jgi:uncharacterized membrane protein YfcA
MHKNAVFTILAGAAAGTVNALLGAGGGMVLVPLLTGLVRLDEDAIFPASVSIILPICMVTLVLQASDGLPWADALPYLIGSAIGGVLAGTIGKKIPTLWLHRALGAVILWGGCRYLWSR